MAPLVSHGRLSGLPEHSAEMVPFFIFHLIRAFLTITHILHAAICVCVSGFQMRKHSKLSGWQLCHFQHVKPPAAILKDPVLELVSSVCLSEGHLDSVFREQVRAED